MNIFYISSACSEDILKFISNKYMKGVPLKAPQQTFDLSIALGLNKYANVNLISIPPVPSYPKSNCIIFPKYVEKINDHLRIEYIPVINLPLIKSFCIFIYLIVKTLIWVKKLKDKQKYILLHWPYYPSMLAAYITRLMTKVKVILTIPDIPAYSISYREDSMNNIRIVKFINKLKPDLISKFDGYVLLTKYMRQKLNIMDKPFTVMEGLIRSENILLNNHLKNKYNKKVIMYAGAVYKKFGLKKLVEAFHKYVGNREYELWIFGTGDFVPELKKYESINKRIKYKGIKFRDEILEAEKKATLLVNPRPSDEEFTLYSFPSKTLEYMSSGTPLLSTKLKGIPEEYTEYILWIEDETVEGIGKELKKILEKGEVWLHKRGKLAQKWVLENKNAEKQTKKIINLIKEL